MKWHYFILAAAISNFCSAIAFIFIALTSESFNAIYPILTIFYLWISKVCITEFNKRQPK